MNEINDLDVSYLMECENNKIVKEKMKELKLNLEDIKEFVPFDEWDYKLSKNKLTNYLKQIKVYPFERLLELIERGDFALYE